MFGSLLSLKKEFSKFCEDNTESNEEQNRPIVRKIENELEDSQEWIDVRMPKV